MTTAPVAMSGARVAERYFAMKCTEAKRAGDMRTWLFKSSGKKQIREFVRAEQELGLEEDHSIICRQCGHGITTLESMISVNSQHKHAFTNPAGFTYHIRCFSSASGCIVLGEPTLNFTWFEGFRWNFAFCSNCYVHLGWYYQSGIEYFYGLIQDRLG